MLRRIKLISIITICCLASCDSPRPSGILCGDAPNFSCPNHMYCKMDGHCGGIDKQGVCVIRPEYCDEQDLTPVCGCDNITYDNACWAAAKSKSVRHAGACK